MAHGSGDAPDLFHGDALNLPIAGDTMNLVLLPHTLDFCENPHQALREADRVLRADGHLVIVGFNPHSLWGLRHLLGGWRGQIPWNGEFYSRWRVSEWLSVLSFRVVRSETFYLRPPLAAGRLIRGMRFMENARPLLGGLGACYVIHARKQTIPMTLVRDSWRRPSAGLAAGSLVHRSRAQAVSKTVTDIRPMLGKPRD
ncbi:methyltransferase domain-containing protein [Granulosicoccaceae sp. 1_MG-2023]|nr:methyltransferase domain-containing protein [Granulosicoccaceae sp. 1_MG-2023]